MGKKITIKYFLFLMCNNLIVSLKYVEVITNEQRKKAKTLIRNELANLTKNNKNRSSRASYLTLSELQEHPSLKNEFLRIRNGLSTETLNSLGTNLKLNENFYDLNKWDSMNNNIKI